MSYSPPSTAKPFTLHISDQDVSEWRQLLQLSKLGPDTYEGRQEDGRFGISHKWLSEAKDYWLNEYDWRAEEKRINSFDNYKMQIESIDLHFVAIFSEKKDAIPIIFMHGWPGSFVEFLPMCALIREQYSAKDLPYHIIVPSLPGYTLSSGIPVDRDWTLQDSARILNQLMLNLGFNEYLAQGGDVGSFEARIMAQVYPACIGQHLNMMSTSTPPDESTLTPLERTALSYSLTWRQTGTAYALEQSTRPSTISHVLSSSPLALLAWIGEKFLEWSDATPPLPHILTDVSLYWFTASLPTSLYPYRDLFAGSDALPLSFCHKFTGFSFFPRELITGIRSVLEENCNLVFYKQHESGGHFAALEKPEELWADVQEFAKLVWEKKA